MCALHSVSPATHIMFSLARALLQPVHHPLRRAAPLQPVNHKCRTRTAKHVMTARDEQILIPLASFALSTRIHALSLPGIATSRIPVSLNLSAHRSQTLFLAPPYLLPENARPKSALAIAKLATICMRHTTVAIRDDLGRCSSLKSYTRPRVYHLEIGRHWPPR